MQVVICVDSINLKQGVIVNFETVFREKEILRVK